MTLNKALKHKNKLVQEISNLKLIMSRENSRSEDSKSKIDRGEVWNKLSSTIQELVKVKANIAVANSQIWDKIFQISENKSMIEYLRIISTFDEKRREFIGGDIYKEVQYNTHLKQEDIDYMISTLETEIHNLQDQIDTHNAVTQI